MGEYDIFGLPAIRTITNKTNVKQYCWNYSYVFCSHLHALLLFQINDPYIFRYVFGQFGGFIPVGHILVVL